MRRLVRPLLFIALLPLVYLAATLVVSRLHFKGSPLLQLITGNRVEVGGWGQALRKFREIEEAGQVDLLFLGSSHCYRGFDPRIFAAAGYRSYNLGSTSQTPLNSYYVLKHYFPKMHPKLVVFEIYPLLLSMDGIESFYDLVSNLPPSGELLEMAVALKNPQALHALVNTLLTRMKRPLASVQQKEIGNETYISGGYCETKFTNHQDAFNTKTSRIELNQSQLSYLRKIIRYVREQQADILLVTQPLPAEYLKAAGNFAEVTATVAKIAEEEKVRYLDYNKRMSLDSSSDFYDDDHLTVAGVHKYNALLVKDLARQR